MTPASMNRQIFRKYVLAHPAMCFTRTACVDAVEYLASVNALLSVHMRKKDVAIRRHAMLLFHSCFLNGPRSKVYLFQQLVGGEVQIGVKARVSLKQGSLVEYLYGYRCTVKRAITKPALVGSFVSAAGHGTSRAYPMDGPIHFVNGAGPNGRHNATFHVVAKDACTNRTRANLFDPQNANRACITLRIEGDTAPTIDDEIIAHYGSSFPLAHDLM